MKLRQDQNYMLRHFADGQNLNVPTFIGLISDKDLNIWYMKPPSTSSKCRGYKIVHFWPTLYIICYMFD